jgi:hypothetical protein
MCTYIGEYVTILTLVRFLYIVHRKYKQETEIKSRASALFVTSCILSFYMHPVVPKRPLFRVAAWFHSWFRGYLYGIFIIANECPHLYDPQKTPFCFLSLIESPTYMHLRLITFIWLQILEIRGKSSKKEINFNGQWQLSVFQIVSCDLIKILRIKK